MKNDSACARPSISKSASHSRVIPGADKVSLSLCFCADGPEGGRALYTKLLASNLKSAAPAAPHSLSPPPTNIHSRAQLADALEPASTAAPALPLFPPAPFLASASSCTHIFGRSWDDLRRRQHTDWGPRTSDQPTPPGKVPGHYGRECQP